MRISFLKTLILVVTGALLALGIAACGGGGGGGAKSGGTLKILDTAGGVDSLDPGYWYYQADYSEIAGTTQRTLYAFRAADTTPQPDLATGLPVASNARPGSSECNQRAGSGLPILESQIV